MFSPPYGRFILLLPRPERRRLGKLKNARRYFHLRCFLAGPHMGHGLEFERWPQPVGSHTQQASQCIHRGIHKIIAVAASAVLLGFTRTSCHLNGLEFALCAVFFGFKKSGLCEGHAANGLAIPAMADQLRNRSLGKSNGQLTTLALRTESVVHQITHGLEALGLIAQNPAPLWWHRCSRFFSIKTFASRRSFWQPAFGPHNRKRIHVCCQWPALLRRFQ